MSNLLLIICFVRVFVLMLRAEARAAKLLQQEQQHTQAGFLLTEPTTVQGTSRYKDDLELQ